MPVWWPVVVNLALGVPAILPLYCAWWLVTKWVPMDCESIGEAVSPGFDGSCSYTTLDHGPVMMLLLVVTALPVLLLLVLLDVVWPLAREHRLGPWLAATALVLVPFDVLWGLAALS